MWWLPRMLARHPPRIPEGTACIEPPCVDAPSAITVRWLRVFDARLLHQLLHLESLSIEDKIIDRRHVAQSQAKNLENEANRWARVRDLLCAVISEVQAAQHGDLPIELAPASGEIYPIEVRELAEQLGYEMPGRRIDIVEVSAISYLVAFARRAQQNEHEIRYGSSIVGSKNLKWSPLLRARANAKESPKVRKQWTRERLRVLERAREELGWTRADIADLIAASERDWDPPPIQLLPMYRYEWQATTQRNVSNRARLIDWIRERLRDDERNIRRRGARG